MENILLSKYLVIFLIRNNLGIKFYGKIEEYFKKKYVINILFIYNVIGAYLQINCVSLLDKQFE